MIMFTYIQLKTIIKLPVNSNNGGVETRTKPKAPQNPSPKHIGFMRYKSPANYMWATIGFTEKLSVDCHHKGHIVRHHSATV